MTQAIQAILTANQLTADYEDDLHIVAGKQGTNEVYLVSKATGDVTHVANLNFM